MKQMKEQKKVYDTFAEKIGAENLYTAVEGLNRTLHIPSCLKRSDCR